MPGEVFQSNLNEQQTKANEVQSCANEGYLEANYACFMMVA
jgi:hypothetical protein